MRDPLSKIRSLDEVAATALKLREQGRCVVTTNGCFDLLHWGHIQYLHQARSLGDCLIVLLNTDSSVSALKGPHRPIQNETARLRQMAGLESVDYVCLFGEPTPEAALARIQPNIHCKGGDYRPQDLPEAKVVQAGGGKVECLKLEPGFSTTSIVERILQAESH